MKNSLLLLSLVLGTALPGWAQVRNASVPTAYRITDLGTLGGDTSGAGSLNNKGQIVGNSDTAQGSAVSHQFLWQNGRMTDLTAQGFPGHAEGINDNGVIVGTATTPPHSASAARQERPFLWKQGKAFPLMGLGGSAEASGLNNRGQVVGTLALPGSLDKRSVFVWDNGQVRRLGITAEDASSGKVGLNNAGDVVGTLDLGTAEDYDYGYTRGFLWRDGRIRRRFSLGSKYGYAHAVNALGEVVGEADLGKRDENGDTDYAAVLWRDDRWQDLNRCLPAHSGWYLEAATGINDRGEIVGYGLRHGRTCAFLMTPREALPAGGARSH